MFICSSWEKWQLKFEIEGVDCGQRPALFRKGKKEKTEATHRTSLWHVTQRLCLHLNRLTPTVSHRYIHVNMAGAGAVTAVMFEWPEKEDFCRTKRKAESL